jgi:hypothetical protein
VHQGLLAPGLFGEDRLSQEQKGVDHVELSHQLPTAVVRLIDLGAEIGVAAVSDALGPGVVVLGRIEEQIVEPEQGGLGLGISGHEVVGRKTQGAIGEILGVFRAFDRVAGRVEALVTSPPRIDRFGAEPAHAGVGQLQEPNVTGHQVGHRVGVGLARQHSGRRSVEPRIAPVILR